MEVSRIKNNFWRKKNFENKAEIHKFFTVINKLALSAVFCKKSQNTLTILIFKSKTFFKCHWYSRKKLIKKIEKTAIETKFPHKSRKSHKHWVSLTNTTLKLCQQHAQIANKYKKYWQNSLQLQHLHTITYKHTYTHTNSYLNA